MIPTAEEFFMKFKHTHGPNNHHKALIEFAKMHVQAALEAKIEAMRETYTYGEYSLDELNGFTKNAYPVSNIK